MFQGIEERNPVSVFRIEVELPLFLKNRVPVQDGPMFCLQLLTTAFLAGRDSLDKLQAYQVVGEDFRPLLVERERRAAEIALKKPHRKPFRKPSFSSNVQLGISSRQN